MIHTKCSKEMWWLFFCLVPIMTGLNAQIYDSDEAEDYSDSETHPSAVKQVLILESQSNNNNSNNHRDINSSKSVPNAVTKSFSTADENALYDDDVYDEDVSLSSVENVRGDTLERDDTTLEFGTEEQNVAKVVNASVVSVPAVGKSMSSLELSLNEALGRPRLTSSLGPLSAFPTPEQEPLSLVDLEVEHMRMEEEVKSFKFRGHKGRRKLNAPVKRWKHVVNLNDDEPKEGQCGFPICVLVDSRPRRFFSLCAFARWAKEQGLTSRRVFELQKGSCEDAIENKGLDRPWAPETLTAHHCKSSECQKHEECSTSICVNDDGHAKTFDTICDSLLYLKNKTDLALIAATILDKGATCKSVYSSCILTEWFDLDEPCKRGEVESVYVTNVFAASIKNGRHRACGAAKVVYPAQFETLEGQSEVKHLVFSKDKDKLVCYNDHNKKRLKPPYHWEDKEVTCRDFRIRYCCKNLWGEAVVTKNIPPKDVIVDKPLQKTLFEECRWLNFMSVSQGSGVGDVESRAKNFKFAKKSVCNLDRFSALFIDSRRIKDDLPADETGEWITKNSPVYGFYCDNRNNEVIGKKCSDYKVRFCCKKEAPSQWGKWSEWSECSRSCGAGSRSRDRVCVQKTGSKETCFNGGPHGDKRFRWQKEICNRQACPKDLQWQSWLAWSSCSASCGSGTRIRQRGCLPATGDGKQCPPAGDPLYFEKTQCHNQPCPNPQWTAWGAWSSCSTSCGLGSRSRLRACLDVANGNRPAAPHCPGPAVHDSDCDAGACPVDGGLTQWQNWGECSVNCGSNGVRVRRRHCAQPIPKNGGKDCDRSKMSEEGECPKLRPCPQHCLFSQWGQWSECSVKCGSGPEAGTRVRERHVAQKALHGGMQCMGSLKEAKQCDFCPFGKKKGKEDKENKCISECPVDCELSAWSAWSGTCRACYKPSDKALVSRVKRVRTRFVETEARFGGKKCRKLDNSELNIEDGNEIELKECRPDKDVPKCPTKVAPYWTLWSEWEACEGGCKVGRTGTRKRSRRCVAKKGKHKCKGKTEEKEQCMPLCPPSGWTEWDNWSPCRQTCGKGQSARKRTCRDDHRQDLKPEDKTCKGTQRQTRVCDSGPCNKLELPQTEGEDVTGLVIGEIRETGEGTAERESGEKEETEEEKEQEKTTNEKKSKEQEIEDESQHQEGEKKNEEDKIEEENLSTESEQLENEHHEISEEKEEEEDNIDEEDEW